MKPLRTGIEQQVGKNIDRIFTDCSDPVEIKLENFPKYVRRQHLKRFLALYEIFKLILPVKGSIVECGVYRGFGLMSWAKLSTILEPENLTRRIYGFDTFEGFPSAHAKDQSEYKKTEEGELASSCYDELLQLIKEYDSDRFLGHIGKAELIRGDMVKTIPEFIEKRQHLVVSLLFLDCDLYEPTKAAIEYFLPRMPKGAVIAFDELDNPIWPGETSALLDTVGVGRLKLRRIEWDPYICYAVLE
ncbi:MAG: class I SAM-dependent methyltransferase [Nitrospirae bacterium]|nr:class I SAM-dependent methyltransferase [Nitrospirota bacterium]